MADVRPIHDRGSDFGRQVAIDLQPDADFDENGGGPDHRMPFRADGRFRSLMRSGLFVVPERRRRTVPELDSEFTEH
jgi:hypothetical protein